MTDAVFIFRKTGDVPEFEHYINVVGFLVSPTLNVLSFTLDT